MASPNDARQQTATQQQDGNSVVFSAPQTELDNRIKSLGLYTPSNLPEINQLLMDLHRIFDKDNGLWDGKDIYIRLYGETNTTHLTTALAYPETYGPERKKYLFLSDYCRILIGLAKTLNAIWQDDELRKFTDSLDDFEELRQLDKNGNKDHVTEDGLAYNAYKILELLEVVTGVFEKRTGVKIETATKEELAEAVATTEAGTATIQGSATVPSASGKAPENDTEGSSESDDKLGNIQENSTIITETLFISSAAYTNLIAQFLEKAGLTEADLPPEMQQQLAQLKQTLKDRLWDLIKELPPEQRRKLLSHRLRLFLYQKLLIQLQQDPLFYVQLNQFYQSYTRFVYQKNGLAVAEERIAEIGRYFATLSAETDIDSQELNQVLEKIRAEIKAWKARIAEEASEQQQQDKVEQQQPAKDEDQAVKRLAPPHVHFTASQEAQLETYLNNTGYDDKHRKIIQDQSARILWGTLAELFKDDADQLGKLPPHLHDYVYNHTMDYILSLSKDELEILRKSPASANRHVMNSAYRLLGDATFQHNYSQYTDTKTATIISRANRIEKETQWAYQQIIFELFSAHNITDPTVPDAPELQGLFDTVKGDLGAIVFSFVSELKTEDLLHLYLHSKDRTQFLQEIYKYLNADAAFIEELSQFYNNLITHYQDTQQTQQSENLQRSLNTLVQLDGNVVKIRASAPSPQALLDNSLGTILKTDSKIIFDQSDTVLRTLVLDLGLEDTISLIQKNRIDVLNAVFQLPPGTLNDSNIDEYRALLSEYAKVRSSELMTNTAGIVRTPTNVAQLQMMYPGLQLSSGASTTQAASTSSVTATQIESVRTVQTVVQSKGKDGDEVLAEGTDLKTIKQKRDIVMKIFGSEWGKLAQADQVAIYLYYDLAFNEQSVKADINNQLPFPFEYIDFRAKKDYDKLLEKLTDEYLKHGKKNFNQYLTAEYLDNETPAADHQRNVNNLILEVKAYEFAQKEVDEQLAIAQQAGFVSAAAFVAQQDAVFQNALVNQANAEAALQQWAFMDAVLKEDLAALADTSDQAYLSNLATQGSFDPEQAAAAQGGLSSLLSPKQQLMGALKRLTGNKVKNEVAKQGAVMAAKAGLGVATGGIATAITIGATLLQNKQFREFVIYGSTAMLASLLYALSTIGGLLGALLGGSFGLLAAGPLGAFGALGGGLLGAYTGAQLFPQQWGGWMGFTPRQAPGLDMLYPENNASISDVGMRAARTGVDPASATTAANAANAGGFSGGTGSIPVSVGAPTTISAPLATAAGTTAGTTAAAASAASSSGFFSGLLGMSTALATPVIGLVSVTLLTTATLLVIVGAFLVPIPTRDSNWKGENDLNPDGTPKEIESQFINVDKVASVTEIENNTPTEVTYTITVTPKNGYTIKITNVTDTFSQSDAGGPALVGINTASFPVDPITEPIEVTYKVTVGEGLTDTRVTNNLTVGFEAINRNGYTVTSNGIFKTAASIKVGDPVEGCWPITGAITQTPNGSGHGGRGEDAYDISAPSGTLVFAPYSGNYCIQPPSLNKAGEYIGYGIHSTLTTTIDGTQAVFTFGHLRGYPFSLAAGQCTQVTAGQLIAYSDNTGNSTGPHLHYELDASGLRLQDLVPEGAPRDCRQ